MDMALFLQWAGAFGLILSIVNTSWTMMSRGAKGVSDKISKYGTDLANHDRRIQAVEAELKHLPGRNELHELRVAITKLEGHLTRLDEAVGAVSFTVRRIDDHLREEK